MRPSLSSVIACALAFALVLATGCNDMAQLIPPTPTSFVIPVPTLVATDTPVPTATVPPTPAPPTVATSPTLAAPSATLPAPTTAAATPTTPPRPVASPTSAPTVRPTSTITGIDLYINPDQLWGVRYRPSVLRPEATLDGTIVFRTADSKAWAAVDSYVARGNEYGNTGEGLRNRARDVATRLLGKAPSTTTVLKTDSNFWQTGIGFTTADGVTGEAYYTQPERTQGDFRVYGLIYAYPAASKQALVPAFQEMKGSLLPVVVRPLTVATGKKPLWLVASRGMRNYDQPALEQGHFIALYTKNPGWQLADHIDLHDAGYVDPKGAQQVQVETSRLWISVESGVGAHGGCFELFSFDDNQLQSQVAACHSSPGAAQVRDLNGDGVQDVILNETENYVFCYACGVRFTAFSVLRWDGTRFVGQKLEPNVPNAPAAARDLVRRAVELAQGELWQQARQQIDQARQLAPQDTTIAWDSAIIRLFADARAEQARSGAYPLLDNLFNGDYTAVLNQMKAYTPAQLFTVRTPLIVATQAVGWEGSLSDYITTTTTANLRASPNLAAAYFVRGWGIFQHSPGTLAALPDVEKAAQLEPANPLYTSSVTFLRSNLLPPLSVRERLQFAPGATSASVPLTLTAGTPRAKVLRIFAQQRMTISVPTTVAVAVLDPNDNAIARSAPTEGKVEVAIPATGDYTVVFFGQGNVTATISLPPR